MRTRLHRLASHGQSVWIDFFAGSIDELAKRVDDKRRHLVTALASGGGWG